MLKLPLFPLNTVLFPGMPLQLHIFEERYKLMISECLQQKTPFGVVLIAEGQEALGPLAKPYKIGCTARIIQMEPLDGERMNINSVGEERFLIREVSDGQPYLTATVELFPIKIEDRNSLKQVAARFAPSLKRYLEIMAQIGNLEIDQTKLPTDPLELAYISAYIVQTSPRSKQDLLEANTADELFGRLRQVFRKEISLLKAMTDRSGENSSEIFSKN